MANQLKLGQSELRKIFWFRRSRRKCSIKSVARFAALFGKSRFIAEGPRNQQLAALFQELLCKIF